MINIYCIMKTILVDAVYCFIEKADEGFRIFKSMYEMLETFPNRKILLTGAPDEKIKEYGLDTVPYEYFTLKMNPKKSDPNYYKLMLEYFGLRSDQVVYFEHNTDAIHAAEMVGIQTYAYDEKKHDVSALKKWLLERL